MFLFGPPNVDKLIAYRKTKRLIKALRYRKNSKVRAAAARGFQEIGDAHAVEPLITALQDPEVLVRKEAIIALGHIGDVRAIQPFIDAMEDHDDVSKLAASWFDAIKDPKAANALAELLKHQDYKMRMYATVGLAQRKDPRAFENLAEVLENELLAPSYGDRKYFWQAFAAVEEMRPDWPNIFPLLLNALKDKDAWHPAIKALIRIDPGWRKEEGLGKVINALLTVAAILHERDVEFIHKQLDELDPNWASSPAARDAFPDLIFCCIGYLNFNLVGLLDSIQQDWRQSEAAIDVWTKGANDPDIRRRVKSFFRSFFPDWRQSEALQRVMPSLLARAKNKSAGWQQAISQLYTIDSGWLDSELSATDELHEWHVLVVSVSKLRNLDPNWPKSHAARTATPFLGELLADPETSATVKRVAQSKLEEIGTSAAIDGLANALNDPRIYFKFTTTGGELESWVKRAARTLAEHGDSRVLAPLMKLLQKHPWLPSFTSNYQNTMPKDLSFVVDTLEKLLEVGSTYLPTSDLQLISSMPPVKWECIDSGSFSDWDYSDQIERWDASDNCSRLKRLADVELHHRAIES